MLIKNTTRKLLLGSILSAIMLFSYQCKHDPDTTGAPAPPDPPDPDPALCDTSNVTYPGTVVPILQANCYGCHSGNTTNGGIDLTDYATVAFLAQNGTLSGVINHADGYKAMPPFSKLDSCDIAKVDKWISDTTFSDPPDEGHPCDPDTAYFQNEVLPLILSTCSTTGCHDKLTDDQDILFVDYASIIEYGEIEPGDPEESKLYKVITDDDPDDRMPPPPKSPLNADQINTIRTWISQGAKDNYCDESCDTTNVTFSGTVWPILETSCVGCHSGPTPQGGINLSDYSNVVAVANTGKLYGAISHSQGYSPMPKNLPKLSDCKIEQVKIWIDDGTPNN